jgi:hypothetical protein
MRLDRLGGRVLCRGHAAEQRQGEECNPTTWAKTSTSATAQMPA